MADDPHIVFEKRGHILLIEINRPEVGNAHTTRMVDEFIAALDEADRDDGIRAVIFTGKGREFCVGGDLSTGADTFDQVKGGRATDIDNHRESGGAMVHRIIDCKKPVIAAINGHAVGVGMTMIIPCDIKIFAEGAKLGMVFTRRGIVPDGAATWLLSRMVGIGRALDWCVSGRYILSDEALSSGFIQHIAPREDVLAKAFEIAEEICERVSPVAASLTRRAIWDMAGARSIDEALEAEGRLLYMLGASDEPKEGVMSFLEKRPANFPLKVSEDHERIYNA